MAGTKVQVQFTDETGQGAVQEFFSNVALAPNSQAGLVTVLNAISDAGINGMKFTQIDYSITGDTADGVYSTPEDKLLLTFRSVGGNYQIAIPAPDEAAFGSDKETADQAFIQGFIDVVETYGADPNGNALTYVSGERTKTSTKSGNKAAPPSS